MGAVALALVYQGWALWFAAPDMNPWHARSAVALLAVLHLLLLTLWLPGPAAVSLARDRESGALQALLLTALTPAQIVAARWLVGTAPTALSLVALAPLLWIAGHAARFPPGRLVLLALVLLAAGAGITAASLWLSARLRPARVAVVAAYALTAVGCWGTLVPFRPLEIRGENLWWLLSPVFQVAWLCLAEPVGAPLVLPVLPEWGFFLAWTGIVTFLSLRGTIMLVATGADR